MESIEKQLHEMNKLQNLQQRSHWMNNLHPLGKLLLCVGYILIVASFDKYDLSGMIMMAIYPVFGFIAGELSFKEGIYRMRLILPLVLFVGIFNPFFDRTPVMMVNIPNVASGGVWITQGFVSMLTLMLKGFYCVLSAYILIATTSIEQICYALRILHVPKIIVIVILLIYRYFGLMGNEADRIATAYMLRAPKQKGIHYKAWGTLVGQWLLRSMDRAGNVYESMLLRGFNGDFRMQKRSMRLVDVIYPAALIATFILIRFVV
jgi:cobalt/nickel transport system permease protein